MSKSSEPLAFIVSSHGHLPGVRLSLLGSYGNVPYLDDLAADRAAIDEANGRPFTIERKRYRALPAYRGVKQ